MTATEFDRDALARQHAATHAEMSPGISAIYYLPRGAPAREIRLIEVSTDLPDLTDNPIEPIGFGLNRGTDEAHRIEIADVSLGMWDRIRSGGLKLPAGWSLDGAVELYATASVP